MTTFDDRESAFEAKFAHDEEKRFLAYARRNRAVGLWAAGLLGHAGADADAYAGSVMREDLKEAGDDDVVRKLAADLQGKATEAEIRARLSQALAEVQAQMVRDAG